MNNKGFTLIELLAAIMLLAVIMTISTFSVISAINRSKSNSYDSLKEYTKILYAEARLIEGLSIENPTEISNLICEYLAK